MVKHSWTQHDPDFTTAKQLLEEGEKMFWYTCQYPGCEAKLFHEGKYCLFHKEIIANTPTPSSQKNLTNKKHIDNRLNDR